MSDPFSFESDSVQRVRGASMPVVGLVTWGSWTAAYTLLAALGFPALSGLTFFFGPALWFVAARRWLAPAPGHGSVEWSGEALTVLSGGLQLTVARARVLGGASFPEPHESVRLALDDGDELRIEVPDATAGERLLAALGCDARARPYAFVGDARARAVERAHRGLYAGFVAGGALAAFAAGAAGLHSLTRTALALGTLAAMVVAYRVSLVAPVLLGADGLRVEGPAPRWIALSSIAGMRTAEGTLVLTLDDRTAAYLHGTAASDDEATAAAVTRRIWALQRGERTDPETAAALAPGAARADDGVYRRASTGREPLRVALRDAHLPAPLRLEAARRLAAEGPDGAAVVRSESAAWVDADARRALAAIAPG